MEYHDKIVACAQAAHDSHRAYCAALGEKVPAWEYADDWMRTSTVEGVHGVIAGDTPEESHERWMARKLAEGWKYGPVKDAANHLHPCIVPYESLTPEQRAKDDIFIAVVTAVARALQLMP